MRHWTKHFFGAQNFFGSKHEPKMNFNENDLWMDKTELLNSRLSKLPSAKVLLKLEFDTKDHWIIGLAQNNFHRIFGHPFICLKVVGGWGGQYKRWYKITTEGMFGKILKWNFKEPLESSTFTKAPAQTQLRFSLDLFSISSAAPSNHPTMAQGETKAAKTPPMFFLTFSKNSMYYES